MSQEQSRIFFIRCCFHSSSYNHWYRGCTYLTLPAPVPDKFKFRLLQYFFFLSLHPHLPPPPPPPNMRCHADSTATEPVSPVGARQAGRLTLQRHLQPFQPTTNRLRLVPTLFPHYTAGVLELSRLMNQNSLRIDTEKWCLCNNPKQIVSINKHYFSLIFVIRSQ